MQTAPFTDVMISGHVLATKGEKISKSTGNAKIEPVALIDTYGADATRYRACGAQLGKDIAFDETELKAGQKLVTKLWNAFQFVKMQLSAFVPHDKGGDAVGGLYPTDQRLLSRIDAVTKRMRECLDIYEFGLAKIAFEEFFWTDFCDNYLEMVKVRLYKPELFDDGETKKQSAQTTLYTAFYTIIRLLAPYIPHITEQIYQEYFKHYI
jgi:valyl-tRNA synthetase